MSTKQTPNEVEEVKDLEQVEEVQDLTEVPEEVKEIKEPVEEVKAPVLRGGLRGAADPNMIQKHIDNFLAMLCGETPVDSNVRSSAEYWLKRLATGEGEGSTKKIYCHPIVIVCNTPVLQARLGLFVFNNDPTPFTTTTFIEWKNALYTQAGGTIRIILTGAFIKNGVVAPACFLAKTDSIDVLLYGTADASDISTPDVNAISLTDAQFSASVVAFEDGVNAIN